MSTFRITYRRDVPMYSIKAALCEEIVEAQSLEELVEFFAESPQCELVEIQSLSGEL